jgi:hypothetical protein
MSDESFKVDAAIAIPVPRRGRKAVNVGDLYPFERMAVGDSFEVVGKNNIGKARNAFQAWVRDKVAQGDNSWKFISREMSTPDKPETFRVWRVPTTVQVILAADVDTGE